MNPGCPAECLVQALLALASQLRVMDVLLDAICCCSRNRDQFSHHRLEELPVVRLDSSYSGPDVVLVKDGRRICGNGAALASAAITQDKAYFEAKIQQTGVWGVGVATRKANLASVPLGADFESLVLRQDGRIYYDNNIRTALSQTLEEGDVVGVTFDHVDVRFFINGQAQEVTVSCPKGKRLYPCVYVDNNAILDVSFGPTFSHTIPSGFQPIMIEQTIL